MARRWAPGRDDTGLAQVVQRSRTQAATSCLFSAPTDQGSGASLPIRRSYVSRNVRLIPEHGNAKLTQLACRLGVPSRGAVHQAAQGVRRLALQVLKDQIVGQVMTCSPGASDDRWLSKATNRQRFAEPLS